MEVTRILVQMKAEEHLKNEDPLGWFEEVYVAAHGDELLIPWASLAPNPYLVDWMDKNPLPEGKRALVVGCGIGDDAEELARRGLSVTAFDISPTAIEWCRRRFPHSKVMYETADLLNAPGEWKGRFGFIFEAYTLQSLQPPLREKVMGSLVPLLAPRGDLLVMSRAKEPEESPEGPPWPLTREDLSYFSRAGLKTIAFEDFMDQGYEPIRRFRALYRS